MELCKCETPGWLFKWALFWVFFPITVPIWILDYWKDWRYYPKYNIWRKYFSLIICIEGKLYICQTYWAGKKKWEVTSLSHPDFPSIYTRWKYSFTEKQTNDSM